MSVETLREAAEAIREDEPGRDAAEREFYIAVAGLLEKEADLGGDAEHAYYAPAYRKALAVARAYLGET